MARSLLAPTAFVTLLGLAPGCFRAAAPPVEAAMSGATPTDTTIAAAPAPEPAGLVAYAATRSGNARAPSYDDAMMEVKGPDNFVEVEGVGPQDDAPEDDAPQAVVLAFETALQLPPACTE